MLKSILTAALIFGSVNVMAADVCSNQEGSIIYDSATTVGNSVVIVNPRLVLAGGKEALIAYSDMDGNIQAQGVCKALGMKSGIAANVRGNTIRANTRLARFSNEDGSLETVDEFVDYAITTITCQK